MAACPSGDRDYVCSGCLIDRLGTGLGHGRLHRLTMEKTMEKVTALKWLPIASV
jgi:hypothetical protein